jgi:dihydrofolate reductase
MKNINMIVAFSDNYVIGNDKDIPWRIPEDFKYFKEKTLNSTVIMGRKTFESIGKPLPNRENIVISRTHKDIKDVVFSDSLEEAIANTSNENIFIIGGSRLYQEGLVWANNLYITRILHNVIGNVHFPYNMEYVEQLFNLKESSDVKDYYGIKYQFLVHQRKEII